MANLFKVSINPVELADQAAVKDVILVMLGPNGVDQAEQLLQNGGTVARDLNQQAANHLATQLQQAGAVVELSEISASDPDVFSVRLLSFGVNKIPVIKQLREITGLGLKDILVVLTCEGNLPAY